MCNDYELHVTWAQYKRALESVSVTIPPRQGELLGPLPAGALSAETVRSDTDTLL
jgi:hypothetical protein